MIEPAGDPIWGVTSIKYGIKTKFKSNPLLISGVPSGQYISTEVEAILLMSVTYILIVEELASITGYNIPST